LRAFNKAHGSGGTIKFLQSLLVSLAALYALVYLIIALLRMGYPFELEWMEGAVVDHVIRVLSGQKLYVSPSLEFIPFIYTPLYFYVSAAVSQITSVGFFPLRLLSFISSLGCFFFIFLMVKRETRSAFWGIIASCLFAASFRISGAWFDIARADSLFLLLLLAGLYLIKFGDSRRSYLLAGVLFSLSFLTKQVALIILLPMAIYCILTDRRGFVYFIGAAVGIIGISSWLLNRIHDGWYYYYVFHLPMQHTVMKGMYVDFWTKDIISTLPVACLMSLFYIFVQALNSNKKNGLFYSLIFLAMMGAAWLTRLHLGSYDNVLIPAYAVLSILFGLGMHKAFESIVAASANKRKIMEICIYLICIVQFSLLFYNPLAQIPTQKDTDAGRALVDTMAQLPGNVLVPYHGYLPTMAGKRSFAHEAAVSDVIRDRDNPTKTKLIEEISRSIKEKRFSAIIVDSRWSLAESCYVRHGVIFDNPDVFWPVTGRRTRPEVIYVPKSNDTE
jgi:4-amino-4-deoxy-L-arabinose transferase-like glycosyltransferase